MARKQGSRRFLELALIATAFGSVYGTYLKYFGGDLPLRETLAGCVAAILAFWLASQLRDTSDHDHESGPDNPWAILAEQFCFGTGLSLLTHALVTYGILARRTPFLVVGGSLLSAIAITLWRRAQQHSHAPQGKILLVGYDGLSKRLLPFLRVPIAGICGPIGAPLPPGIPVLGSLDQFGAIVASVKPTEILIGVPHWDQQLPSGTLLKLRLEGVRVTEAASLYERVFSRICCERLQPVDLVLSTALRGDARTMAIQAIYNNLIGLAFLVLLSPLLLIIAAAVALSGPGPVNESLECAGFQYIPFRLQRFRTTDSEGRETAVGRVLKHFHLVNLPQLVNVVRGEMALVGPRPVRSKFAACLSATMPFYAHRFSVKPGLVGWAEVYLSPSEVRDARLEIEYDLYYIKASSLWLDLEILSEQLPWGAAKQRAAEVPL